jgi:hypothetical protein
MEILEPMRRPSQWILWTASLFGVPVLFFLFVLTEYWMASKQGHHPIDVFPSWYWFAAYGTSLVFGVVLVFATSLRPAWVRIVAAIVYLAIMSAGLIAVHILAACYSGDCI